MVRGERLIKLGNSWFSAKTIEVVRRTNSFGGRALNGLGESDLYQTQSNSEYQFEICGRHTVGANFHGGEENNPDRPLRSPSYG